MTYQTISAPNRGVSLTEVLVVIAVLLLLLAMLLPNLGEAREQARRILCQNNLKQWGIANQMYRDEHRDHLPTEGTYLQIKRADTWFNALPPYLDAPSYWSVEGQGKDIREFPELHMWICPSKNLSKVYKSDSGKNQFHYGMNMVLDGMDSALTPDFPDIGGQITATRYAKKPETVFMFDIWENSMAGYQKHVGREYHGEFANVLKLDGTVGSFRAGEFVVNGDFENAVPIWNHPRMYWGYTPKAQAAVDGGGRP